MRSRRGFVFRFRQLVSLYIHILLSIFVNCHASLEQREFPVVHLRVAPIDTGKVAHSLPTSPRGRRLLFFDCHTEHPSWGHLSGTYQALITHRSSLHATHQHDLLDHLQACGTHVAGYLPDHTLLVVGSPEALSAAANHSAVVWAGGHEPEWKIAPELAEVLRVIESKLASARKAALGKASSGNATAAQHVLFAASIADLPLQLQYRSGEWPLIGVMVSFPASSGPSPHADDHPHVAKLRAMLESQTACHAGTAASVDWAPLMRRAVGGGIEVHPAGRSGAVVLVPAPLLRGAVEWLSARPAVHWLEPLRRHFIRNREASSVIQSARPAPKTALDPGARPFWAAGITGAGQVVGSGDSGIDVNHCFFNDPNYPWPPPTKSVNRVRTFVSENHRKITMYHGFADFADANGHGTHTSGTLIGMPLGKELKDAGSDQVGMAPSAKVAFLDLSGGTDGDAIITPWDLDKDYFSITAIVGARVHSDSWGSDSILYDQEAAMVDDYCWRNPDFLPVFPSGNDGATGANSGLSTVNSPATSKNCIAAGATQSTREFAFVNSFKELTRSVTVSVGSWATSYRVLQSDFSTSVDSLTGSYPLAVASPLQACEALDDASDVAGSVVLIERGGCNFDVKAKFAQQAGSAAVIIFDSEAGAFFVPSSAGGTSAIPVVMIPRRQGRNALAIVNSGRQATVTFGPADSPRNGFENLAPFSSQGPVGRDRRVKPDLVAPGTITSAAAGTPCDVSTYGGTSMSTPVIAGAALLVRQYFMDGFFPSGAANPADAFTPSSALIKAVLIAGAASLQGYEADTGLPIDPRPSFRQGFGRIHLGDSLPLQSNPSGPKRVVLVDKVPIVAGVNHTYCLTGTGGPMTVVLVWTDPRGNPSARKALVNDLNLIVRAEGLNGERLLGNGGDAEDSGRADSVNNIEEVDIDAVPPGKISIEVIGQDVQAFAGPQPYALVVNGDFEGALVVPSDDNAQAGECAVVTAVIASGPGKITNESAIRFELSTTTGSATRIEFECRMGDASGAVGAPGTFDWKVCPNPAVFNDLPDGSYTFSARASGEATEATQSFIKKTVPPQVQIDAGGVPSVSSSSTATLAFGSSDTTAVKYQCRISVSEGSNSQGPLKAGDIFLVPIEPGRWFNCTSPKTVAWMQPGQWTFEVKGTDIAGNEAAPVSTSWSVALEPGRQYARVLAGPINRIPLGEVIFDIAAMVSSGEGVGEVVEGSTTALECALAKGEAAVVLAASLPWEGCSGSASYGQPESGTYTFVVRVAGDAPPTTGPPTSLMSTANDPSTPSTWSVSEFEVDATPPTVTLAAPVPSEVSALDVEISFELSEQGATAECELTSKDDTSADKSVPSTPCSSPVILSNLTDGRYAFSILPTDAVGNVGEALVTDFAVDTTPPIVTEIVVPMAVRDGSNVQATFSVDDGPGATTGLQTTCKITPVAISPGSNVNIDSESEEYGWRNCTSPLQLGPLVEGHWRLSVQATDAVGLVSEKVDADVWVDTIAPRVNVSSAPRASSLNPGGDVVFELSDASEGAAAGSPVQWQALMQSISGEQLEAYRSGTSIGSDVTATPSGSQQRLQSAFQVVDENNTAVGTSTKQQGPANEEDFAPLGAGDVGAWTNCTGQNQCVFRGLKGGAYTFQARGIDAAGNSGNASQPYAFEVEGASSSGMPTWLLGVIIGGGVLAVIVVVALVWCCCRRSGRNAVSSVPTGAFVSPPTYLGNGYVRPAAGGPHHSGYFANGANGYSSQAHAPIATYGMASPGHQTRQHAGSLRASYAGNAEDPIEAQEMALAIAASQRDTSRRAPEPVSDDAEIRAAIEASLREQQQQQRSANPRSDFDLFSESEEAEIRAAIEASLREQQRQRDPWAG